MDSASSSWRWANCLVPLVSLHNRITTSLGGGVDGSKVLSGHCHTYSTVQFVLTVHADLENVLPPVATVD